MIAVVDVWSNPVIYAQVFKSVKKYEFALSQTTFVIKALNPATPKVERAVALATVGNLQLKYPTGTYELSLFVATLVTKPPQNTHPPIAVSENIRGMYPA